MLDDIVRKNRYLQDAPPWLREKWRKQAALDWFVKNNKEKLEALGAVVQIGNELFIFPKKMPHAAAIIYGVPDHLTGTIDVDGVTHEAA